MHPGMVGSVEVDRPAIAAPRSAETSCADSSAHASIAAESAATDAVGDASPASAFPSPTLDCEPQPVTARNDANRTKARDAIAESVIGQTLTATDAREIGCFPITAR